MNGISNSLANATDLIFHREAGTVTSYPGFLCVRTPSNPTFWWGNYLLFAAPPSREDWKQWPTLFSYLISKQQPNSKHQAYRWIGGLGEAEYFVRLGFVLTCDECLACSTVLPPTQGNHGIQVRNYQASDWDAAIELQVLCREEDHDENESRIFRRTQFELYRQMEAKGIGARYGAFIGKTLVADLGIYVSGCIGRYNNVCTHPQFRRAGIAASLVHDASKLASQQFDLEKFVIVTEADAPNRIYRRLGFVPVETTYSLFSVGAVASNCF